MEMIRKKKKKYTYLYELLNRNVFFLPFRFRNYDYIGIIVLYQNIIGKHLLN